MSTSDRNDFIELQADGFDLEAEMLYTDSPVLYFIKRIGRPTPYTLKYTISRGFKIELVAKTRNRLEFQIASVNDIGAMAAESSHIVWLGKVYIIDDGEITPPSDDKLWWSVFGTVTGDIWSP